MEEAQAEAMQKAAAACSSGDSTQLTVGKAMEASKEAAAQLAAKGLSHQPSSDSADGPSRCHSVASSADCCCLSNLGVRVLGTDHLCCKVQHAQL